MQQQQNYPNSSHLVPLSNYDVTELKLENGHLAIHGLGGLVRAKPTNWSNKACDTLESVVHQATTCHKAPDLTNLSSSSGGAWTGNSGQRPLTDEWIRKRTRSDSDYHGKNVSSTTSTTSNVQEEHARYQRDNTTTINTWASFESLMTKSNDDDSTCHEGMDNRDEERKTTKDDESSRSQSKRPRRVAAIHNQSERKRRDRINQKMKALQRLVPNASKTDKASMLDEVIRYLEQLQAQVQIMNSMRNNMHPHMNMMMPLGMQQQQQQQQQHLHQMSVLARMGMTPVVPGALGMGMGMLDVSNMARMAPHQSLQQPVIHPSPASFLPPFMAAQLMQPKPDHPAVVTNASSEPMANPYCALLAQQQSMNMDFFNKMAALYRQQVNHQAAASSPSQSNH